MKTWEAKYENCSLGERVVLALAEDERGKFKMLFFDNYFNSLPLLEKLKSEKTLACGTIRSNRKGLPENILEDKKLKRGDMDHRTSCNGITFFKWRDTKSVFLASNYHGSEMTLVDRKDDKGKTHKITAPTVIKDYNQFMGGVDHADQLRASYGVHRRSKKWWQRIFWGILDIAFVNSFVVYCRISGEKPPLLDFRRNVALGLMSKCEVNCKKGSLKRTSKSPQQPSNKRRGKEPSVSNDVRLGTLGVHWPTFTEGVKRKM
ncbi:piggyBac transposable element-derived protein 4-like [Homalodisca vitripennis]|uniref:piggyBac transposable element-derived protein 4-like n=1 Tax=Homalodisca vitripennis TaxID=197043 RepID=UPI001EEACD8D|nr:piggyBac transposable element-derived protein 4-like [Homalodisca vitripennis]